MLRAAPTILLLLAAGCTPDDAAQVAVHPYEPRGPDDPVVATVNGERIYLSRVEELARQTGASPRRVAEGMVEMTLLAQEARERGLLDEPRVVRTYEKALVQELLARQVEAEVDPDEITADEVRTYYVENFENKGVLFEDVWRDIWMHLVAERRREVYETLVERLRETTPVAVDERNVELYLGPDRPGSGGG
jgi:hypothetical protein